jgi:hypothetical protein
MLWWAGSQLSIRPLFNAWCCTTQPWSVDGTAWPELIRVLSRKGIR